MLFQLAHIECLIPELYSIQGFKSKLKQFLFIIIIFLPVLCHDVAVLMSLVCEEVFARFLTDLLIFDRPYLSHVELYCVSDITYQKQVNLCDEDQ